MRVLVVDDEPLARRALTGRLAGEPDVELAGEAPDGQAAVAAIRAHSLDLVFLDVRMPGMDGFEVLERLGADALPEVVFVTAFDAHAVRAFEVQALDYLLKPYSEDRFRACLERARQALRDARGSQRPRIRTLLTLLAGGGGDHPAPDGCADRFAVREHGRIVFVAADAIEAVESAGNYVVLAAPPHRHLLRTSLTEIAAQLDPDRFARIHRGTIVRLDRVRSLAPEAHGDCEVRMASGARYRLSRSFRARLLGGPLTSES